MSETYQFKLSYLQAAQAQKHVTVNEALAKLDALAKLRVVSRKDDIPASPIDGQAYIVPTGASGIWLGQDHKIALFLNGGWEFVDAHNGWTAWAIDEAVELRFQNGVWDYVVPYANPKMASTEIINLEFDHVLTAGVINQTAIVIPHHNSVIGITGRVTEEIVFSSAATFKVGVTGSDDRYGSGYGHWLNTYVQGLTGQPQTYWSDTPVLLTADGGDFVNGTIRLSIHMIVLTPPAVV
jgi:hypothetical protein